MIRMVFSVFYFLQIGAVEILFSFQDITGSNCLFEDPLSTALLLKAGAGDRTLVDPSELDRNTEPEPASSRSDHTLKCEKHCCGVRVLIDRGLFYFIFHVIYL